MKRFVCFLLTLVMIVGLVPATVLTARAASELETSDQAIEFIKGFEGFRSTPYEDNGKYYIGYGTYVADPDIYKDGITKSEATILLKNHIHPDDDPANKTVDELINDFAKRWNLAFTQYQHDALASFTYNCGSAWMSNPSWAFTSAVINRKTGNEFLNAICLYNGGNSSSDYFRGLMNRRLAEANMYLNNSYSTTAPASYTYVILDLNGGTINDGFGNNPVAYAFSTSTAPQIPYTPTKSGATFVGWYLEDAPVTVLDKSVSKKTLTARWQSGTDAVKVEKYDINTNEAASLKLYSDKEGTKEIATLKANSKFTVTHEFVDTKGVKWVKGTGTDSKGKTVIGWLALVDMDEKDTPTDTVLATGTITATTLVVRDAATTEGANIGSLKKGDIVKILGYKNQYTAAGTTSWGRINYGGQVGWISMAYVDTRAATDNDNDSVYGKTGVIVNAEKVNIRPNAGVHTGDPIAQLPAGTKVTVYDTKIVGTGANSATWGRIKWDGVKEGWVYLYYVKIDGNVTGSAGSDAGTGVAQYTGIVTSNTNLNVRSEPRVTSTRVTSLPTGTKINIYEKTTTNNVAWGRTDKGWVCLQYVSLTETGNSGNAGSGTTGPGNHVVNKEVGTVTAASLSVRMTPTNNSKELLLLNKGDQVTILDREYEDTTTGRKIWGLVKVDGVEGYINMAYVDVRETADYIPDTDGDITTGSGNATNGIISGCTNVNVRSAAGVRNGLVTTLPAGTKVTVYERTEKDNAPWGRIDQGWVCLHYVTLTGGTTNDTTGNNGGGTINGTTPGVISATGIVNSNTDLNVRSGAGLAYPKVSSLKKGTEVTIYEQVSVDGVTWGKVNGGWICLSYVTINGTTDSGKGVMGTIARCFTAVNVRSAPGTGNALVGTIMVGTRVEIFEQTLYNGQYWGRVAQGWISMQYVALDDELPPESGSEPDQDEGTSEDTGVVNGAVNNNPVVAFSFTGRVSTSDGSALPVRKDATSESNKAGTLNNGTTVNIVALKSNTTEAGVYEIWGKTEDYGTPGWINLAYVDYSIGTSSNPVFCQFDNVTVYSIASSSSQDIGLLRQNDAVVITQLALEGTTVWGKFKTDGVVGKNNGGVHNIPENINGLYGWVQMNKLGNNKVNVAPTHRTSEKLTGAYFYGKTYGVVTAYADVTAAKVVFNFEAQSPVYIDAEDIRRDHGTVWARVEAKDYTDTVVSGWIDITKVAFQISWNVTATADAPVKIVENVNLETDENVVGTITSNASVFVTSLILSDKGELWGQVVPSGDIVGGWIKLK